MRIGTPVTIINLWGYLPNTESGILMGATGTIIARQGSKYVRVRLDEPAGDPFGPDGKGWFLPSNAVEKRFGV